MARGRGQSGFALLIVLWSVVLIAFLTTHITSAGRSEVQLASNLREAASAEAAADAGIHIAIYHVLDPAQRWNADGAVHPARAGRFQLAIQLVDENGKVNPNLAPPDLLAALLTADGVDGAAARALGAAIADWSAPGGSPQALQAYRAAGLPVGPGGTSFRDIADLAFVIGMRPAWLARLKPHLSIYAEGAVNYVHADPVLQSVLRVAAGGSPPAATTEPPTSVATITATAWQPGGARYVRRATVSFGGEEVAGQYRILAWQSGAAD